ncbi:MAG: putative DNA binding domain-containing protein [Synergistaceae bacterium]|nr:putative DNA binding domain-containing protein [Synergistaceae bacterium]
MIVKENQNTEWKAIWKDEYLAWICGFANAEGGKLYIGLDNKGNPVGLKDSRKLLEDLPNKINNTMGITVNVNLHDGDKEYIEIDVPPHPVAISCKGAFYYRSGATNQLLRGAALEAFILRRRGVHWDSSPLPRVDIADIDENVVRDFCARAIRKGRLDETALSESVETVIEKLRMKNGEYLTNAALLVFGKELERLFTGTYIKIGFFETDADLIYQDIVTGSLFTQADRTLDLVYFKYLKAKISYKGIQRIERYPFPEAALREALLNAIVHKDYSSGVPIQISVYDDKIYIANNCRLPESWTAQYLLGKHSSQPFNPSIAHVFYLAGFIESWGRGIEKICHACDEDGIPRPEYTVHPNDIMIKFTAPEDRIIRRNAGSINSEHTRSKSVPPRYPSSTPQVLAVLRAANNETSRSVLQEASGFSDRKHFTDTIFRPLLENGLLEMTNPEKPRSSKQKYRLTNQGREFLHNIR